MRISSHSESNGDHNQSHQTSNRANQVKDGKNSRGCRTPAAGSAESKHCPSQSRDSHGQRNPRLVPREIMSPRKVNRIHNRENQQKAGDADGQANDEPDTLGSRITVICQRGIRVIKGRGFALLLAHARHPIGCWDWESLMEYVPFMQPICPTIRRGVPGRQAASG